MTAVEQTQHEPEDKVLIEVKHLKMYFPVTSGVLVQRTVGYIKAIDDISFVVRRGETLGLVGESGCGKTTTGRCILQLYRPTAGTVLFDGKDLCTMNGRELRGMRRHMQVIFQDPYSSLNPRMTAGNIVGEPLLVQGLARDQRAYRERVTELLSLVGLRASMADRYPHEFSGGQRQRIGVARALAVNPQFVVCDEPVSALDVSIQAQIVNLLERLQDQLGLTYLFITHDLSVARYISDRIAVMYLGKIVEVAQASDLYRDPKHPYTASLISAIPIPDPPLERARTRIIIKGEVPSPVDPPSGCRFRTRCFKAAERCALEVPSLDTVKLGDHEAACFSPMQTEAVGGVNP